MKKLQVAERLSWVINTKVRPLNPQGTSGFMFENYENSHSYNTRQKE